MEGRGGRSQPANSPPSTTTAEEAVNRRRRSILTSLPSIQLISDALLTSCRFLAANLDCHPTFTNYMVPSMQQFFPHLLFSFIYSFSSRPAGVISKEEKQPKSPGVQKDKAPLPPSSANCAKGMILIPALSSPSPPSAGGEIRRPCTLSLPPSFATSSVSSDGSSPAGTNVRKRRAATLSRIDLSAVALTKELCSSSESLNGDKGIGGDARVGEGQQSPSLGAEESLATSGLAFSSFAGPPFSDRSDPLKRLRLCSTSSTSTTIGGSGGSSLSSDSDTEFSPQSVASVHVQPQQQQQRPLKQPPTLAELEFEHGDEPNSPKQAHFASGGLVIGDDSVGIFELVGDGRNCKAVNIATQSVFHCQVMKSDEFRHLSEIVARVQIASIHYSEDEFEQRRDLLLPLQQLLVVRSSIRAGLVYVLLPDHFGNLHQLVEEENFGSDRRNASSTRLTERRMQPILKQIATLVELCHRIGLFFRDFRLRKFVFTDSERTKIRVNNVLDLCLVDNPTNDLLAFREFVPAYVAPEILDKKNALYGAKAADVWAFGVLMFTLLNGRYPFFESSPSPIALLRRIRAHRLSFPISKSISEPSRWLLHALLNHNPSERPAAEELLGAHWFRTDTTFSEGDLANGSKFSVRGKPKYDNEVPIAFGRLVPSVPGRISPPAAQVPSATTRVLFSPSGDSPPSLAELIELRRAQRHSPRWQRQQRASADQMDRRNIDLPQRSKLKRTGTEGRPNCLSAIRGPFRRVDVVPPKVVEVYRPRSDRHSTVINPNEFRGGHNQCTLFNSNRHTVRKTRLKLCLVS
uniref:Protein kinase domain-containing protein n=1 Tax=Globodera rostochiensis TaxID=31243 RepID=A0A914HEL6_GLORO